MYVGVRPLAWPDAGHLSFAVAISACKTHYHSMYTVSQNLLDGS